MVPPFPLPQTLLILSGLPGCGKTTLARLLVQELQLPILTVDDVVDAIPATTWTQVDVQRCYFQRWQTSH